MKRVIVVGGGWSGVSAAVCAKKAGADVILIEKTDLLLGAGCRRRNDSSWSR